MEKTKTTISSSAMASMVIDNIVKPSGEAKQLATVKELGKYKGTLTITHNLIRVQLTPHEVLEVVADSGRFSKLVHNAAAKELGCLGTPSAPVSESLDELNNQMRDFGVRLMEKARLMEMIGLERSTTILGSIAEPLRDRMLSDPSFRAKAILGPQIEINPGSVQFLSLAADPAFRDRITLRLMDAKTSPEYIVTDAKHIYVEDRPPVAGLEPRKGIVGRSPDLSSDLRHRFTHKETESSHPVTISELLNLPPLAPEDVGTAKPGFIKRDLRTGELVPLNADELVSLRASCTPVPKKAD